MILLVLKWASHFEIFDNNDVPIFLFHFFLNKKRFETIECHVQGAIRHCMNNNRIIILNMGG